MILELTEIASKPWGIDDKGTFYFYQIGCIWALSMKMFSYSIEHFAYVDDEDEAKDIFEKLETLDDWFCHTGQDWYSCIR